MPFVKHCDGAPPGFFAAEAAGLRWLAAAGGVRCVPVIGYDDTSLTLPRLVSVPPTAAAAYEFGVHLAVTHDAGAQGFGAGPDRYCGPGFFGPMSAPMPMALRSHDSWGEFYACERLTPMAELAGPRLGDRVRRLVDEVIVRCRDRAFDDDDVPARLHGDLWSGNVMWTADAVVLIDPAAHGGHRETDLAMLELFGCPFLSEVLAGYQSVRPLRDGWRLRRGLHQLYPLLAHVVLFGGAYRHDVETAAASALQLCS